MSAEAACGTYAAYVKHLRLGESPDKACREAGADYVREWRKRTGDKTGKEYARARHAATRELIDAHRDEFKALVAAALSAERADSPPTT